MSSILISLVVFIGIMNLANASEFTNSIGMKFLDIPAGNYMMGTRKDGIDDCPKNNPFTEKNEFWQCADSIIVNQIATNEIPNHQVKVKKFTIQTTEVTNAQWNAIMGNTYLRKDGDLSLPVTKISWNDVKTFVDKLNSKENTDTYSLPTEAQWEYAARAGSSALWSCGNTIACAEKTAWFFPAGGKYGPHSVATKQPNKFGLYDMHGNVWEMTEDCYENENMKEKAEELGTTDCDQKVIRGGGWNHNVFITRSAKRNMIGKTESYRDDVGFRIIKNINN